MSSPHLNNLIIIGAMLTYTSVIFLGLNSRMTSVNMFPYICAARAWLLMAGFSLAFGAMFSKTWRVHSIFTDITINKKVNWKKSQDRCLKVHYKVSPIYDIRAIVIIHNVPRVSNKRKNGFRLNFTVEFIQNSNTTSEIAIAKPTCTF